MEKPTLLSSPLPPPLSHVTPLLSPPSPSMVKKENEMVEIVLPPTKKHLLQDRLFAHFVLAGRENARGRKENAKDKASSV